MITKFKITRTAKRAVIKISTVSIVVDQEYPITEQANMTIDVTERGVPFDTFGFKLGNGNGSWSPEYTATIKGEVNTSTPAIPYVETLIPTTGQTDITSSFVFNTSTDRIKINGINPKYGNLLINGSDVILGKTYFKYEFINVIFSSTAELTSQSITSSITIQAGNKNEFAVANNIDITTKGNLQGSIYGTSDTGIEAIINMAAISNGIAIVTGWMVDTGGIVGVISGIATTTGTLSIIGTIYGTATIIGSLSSFTGIVNGIAILSGTLLSKGILAGTSNGVAITHLELLITGTINGVTTTVGNLTPA